MQQTDLIPALLVNDTEELLPALKKFKECDALHVDIMDGQFTEEVSPSLSDLLDYVAFFPTNLEAHLMVEDPLSYMGGLRKLGVKKVLLHWESFETDSDLQFALEEFSGKGFELGLVFSPGTEIEEAEDYFPEFSTIMIMGVWPGKQGQTLISWTYERLRKVRELKGNHRIQVDGGADADNLRALVEAGADIVTLGSVIAKSPRPEEKLAELARSLS